MAPKLTRCRESRPLSRSLSMKGSQASSLNTGMFEMIRTKQSDFNEEQVEDEMRVNRQLFQDAQDWALFLDGTRKIGNGNMLDSLRRLFLGNDGNKHAYSDDDEDNDDYDNEGFFRRTARQLGCAFLLCKLEHFREKLVGRYTSDRY